MRRLCLLTIVLFSAIQFSMAAEAKLVRYPHYSNGRIVFSYLGDIWTANENGQNIQRLTVNRARDVYPRFTVSRWIFWPFSFAVQMSPR